MIHKSRPL